MTVQELQKQAENLSPTERAALVEWLLASFDHEGREEMDRAWAHEVEGRIDAVDRGQAKPRPAADVFGDIDQAG